MVDLSVNESDGVNTILSFWFGSWALSPSQEALTAADFLANQSAWFKKDEKFDSLISSNFSNLIEKASSGELSSWEESPRGSLALIILLDQFSRNSFRGTPKSFAHDELAASIAKRLVENKFDEALNDIERTFVYMPFMHSEKLEDQNRCVELFGKLVETCRPDMKNSAQNFLKFAIKHQQIIEIYGRFPHRNQILGRESTPQEIEFLNQPGSSF